MNQVQLRALRAVKNTLDAKYATSMVRVADHLNCRRRLALTILQELEAAGAIMMIEGRVLLRPSGEEALAATVGRVQT